VTEAAADGPFLATGRRLCTPDTRYRLNDEMRHRRRIRPNAMARAAGGSVRRAIMLVRQQIEVAKLEPRENG
jgi:hypothetical protein